MANVRPLSDALARRAAIDLNEVPEKIPYYIHTLREWLKSQLHLRTPLSNFYIIFLMQISMLILVFTCRRPVSDRISTR